MSNNLQKIGFSNVYEFIEAIDAVINILQKERMRIRCITGGKINSGLVELDVPNNLAIIGDLHGDLRRFSAYFKI